MCVHFNNYENVKHFRNNIKKNYSLCYSDLKKKRYFRICFKLQSELSWHLWNYLCFCNFRNVHSEKLLQERFFNSLKSINSVCSFHFCFRNPVCRETWRFCGRKFIRVRLIFPFSVPEMSDCFSVLKFSVHWCRHDEI